jgi:hypothetical protein
LSRNAVAAGTAFVGTVHKSGEISEMSARAYKFAP